MKYIKRFEEIKIHDIPTGETKYKRDEKGNKQFKFEEGDYVIFKPLKKIFCIKRNNSFSDNQDYFIYDPFNADDWRNSGWCVEEELKKPTKKQMKEVEHLISAKKFNI